MRCIKTCRAAFVAVLLVLCTCSLVFSAVLNPGDLLGAYNGTLLRFIPDALSGFSSEELVTLDQSYTIRDIAIGPDGNVFLLLSQSIYLVFAKVDAASGEQTYILPKETIVGDSASHMTIDINGDLLVTPSGSNEALIRVNPSTGDKTVLFLMHPLAVCPGHPFCNLPFLSERLKFHASGIAVDINGRIIVAYNPSGVSARMADSTIFQVDRESGTPSAITSEGNLLGFAGITVDNQNRILVSGTIPSDNTREGYTAVIAQVDDAGSGAHTVLFVTADVTGGHPVGDIAVDRDGSLLVADGDLYRSDASTGVLTKITKGIYIYDIAVLPLAGSVQCIRNSNGEPGMTDTDGDGLTDCQEVEGVIDGASIRFTSQTSP